MVKQIIFNNNDNIIKYLNNEKESVIENKNNKLLNGVITEFYPIVIDIEIDQLSNFFLIGIYLPQTNIHLCINFNTQSDDIHIKFIKNELKVFFYFFYTDQKYNPILIGHNIISFDLPIIFLFIKSEINNPLKIFNLLNDFCNKIIKNNKNKTGLEKQSVSQVYDLLKTIYCVDTLLCYDKNQIRNLFRFKIELFFTLKEIEISPLEFDFNKNINLNLEKSFNNWLLYNFNDLYYTLKLAYEKPTTNRLYSRGLLYKNISPKNISFCSSLNKPDSIINTAYISEKCKLNRGISYIENENYRLQFSNLIILFNYHYLENYKIFFNNNNIYNNIFKEDALLKIKNINVKMSVGGLHSTNNKVKKSEKLGYFGNQIIFAHSEDKYIILMLDFQSFYVNLVIELLKEISNTNEEKVLKELNAQRLKLKKEKDPNDAIFKIATLAYTGSLNYYRSSVFNPILYYSMTINGQLMCLELLYKLSEYITKIIEVNTDGVIIYINKKNYSKVMELCDNFENCYKIKIDTRKIIDCGLFYSSNKKIFLDENNKLIVKGFQTKLSFNFEIKILSNLLKNYKSELLNFKKFNNIKFYNCLWECFNTEMDRIKKKKNVYDIFNFHTINGKKILIYFSKNPSFVGGIPNVPRWAFYPYPVKALYFEDHISKKELINNVLNDLDISTYWSYILNKFENFYLYNIQQDIKLIKPIQFENCFINWCINTKIDYYIFYKDNKKILNIFYVLIPFGFILFFKDRDKKSFPKTKMIQSNLLKYYKDKPDKVYKNFFKNFPYALEKGVCLSINLKESFENNICCLDFDGVEWFFKKENFNENDNFNQKQFLNFILQIKSTGFLIYSSMTNTPFDRFKIFFKLKYKPTDLAYKTFKNHNRNDYDFYIEDQASFIGPNLYGQSLISSTNFNNLNKLIEINYEDYINFFNNKDNYLKDLKIEKNYFEMVVDLFNPRDINQRTLYNNLLKNDVKAQNLNFFDFKKYDIYKNNFENLFKKVIEKNNFNNLNINDINELFNYYKFGYDQIKPPKINQNIIPTVVNKSNKNKEKLTQKDFKLKKNNFIEIDHLNPNFLKGIEKLKINSYSTIGQDSEIIIGGINHIIKHINIVYKTNFTYSKTEDYNIIYHTNCIFDNDQPGNHEMVTLFIDEFLFCTINCYHNKCKLYNKYLQIQNALNKNFYCLIVMKKENKLNKSNLTIEDIYEMNPLIN